jgi:hypothetical protein
MSSWFCQLNLAKAKLIGRRSHDPVSLCASHLLPRFLAMFNARHHLFFRRGIASKFVRSHFNRGSFLAFQQLTKETFGSAFILVALCQYIQHVTVLIDGTTKILALALNQYGNLIEKPAVSARTASNSKTLRIIKAELCAPVPNRFVSHDDISFGQLILDVT